MTTTRNIAHNDHGDYFVTTRYFDGSVDQAGPFASSPAAFAELRRQEQEEIEIADALALCQAAREFGF